MKIEFLKKEEISYKVEQSMPFPLADLFRRFRVSRDSMERLNYIFNFTECSMYFVINYLMYKQFDLGLKEKISLKGDITQGNLFRIINNIYSAINKNTNSDNLFATDIFIEFIEVSIKYRNEYVHKGVQTRDRAKATLKKIEPIFYNYLGKDLLLNNMSLSVVEFCDYDGEKFNLVFRRCNGGYSFFESEIIHSNVPIPSMQPIISLKSKLGESYTHW